VRTRAFLFILHLNIPPKIGPNVGSGSVFSYPRKAKNFGLQSRDYILLFGDTVSLLVIELRNVGLSFKAETLLKDVSLNITRGEVFVLIGPSGEGKSSLLKLMGGLIQPTKGEVFLEGKSWRTMRRSEREEIAHKTGMLFQKNALFDSMTVAENVAFPLREVALMPEDEIEKVVTNFLEAVGILHARDQYPDEISGGMQKRLGIARAMAMKPEIVFYDDPTAGLDPITSRNIIQLILGLQRATNTTVVAVTNDMNRANQMADRIGMVVDGELIVCGTPEQTKRHPDPRVQQFIRGELNGPLTVTS
jgi:phospholipid/cholesterol/gamma-HCH transport system ATP-binding protein